MRAYRVQAKDLDVTTNAGATRLELTYAKERAHIPLKAKYRPQRGSYPQWSTGGDYGSRKKSNAPKVRSAPVEQRRMVMVVGPTGKRSMVEEAAA